MGLVRQERRKKDAFYRNRLQKPVLADLAAFGDYAGVYAQQLQILHDV